MVQVPWQYVIPGRSQGFYRAYSRRTGMARFFSISSVGRAHTVHMRMRGLYVKRLRGMCTLCPLSEIEGSIGGMRLAKSGRRVCPKKKKSVDMSCARKSKRNQLLQWNTNSLAESYYTNLATVGSLPLAKNAKHSPSK